MFEASRTRETSALRAVAVFAGTFVLAFAVSLAAVNLLLTRLTTLQVFAVLTPAALSGPLLAAVLNHLALGGRIPAGWIHAANALSFSLAVFLTSVFILLGCATSSTGCPQAAFPLVLAAPSLVGALAFWGVKVWARRRQDRALRPGS